LKKSNSVARAEEELESLKLRATAAMDLLDDNRRKAQAYQDYYDGIQWTADELRVLESRKQPALTFNHIKPAVNAIIGIVERGKTDPKAWGRSPRDQDAAEVATDGLRYVADTTRFNSLRRECLLGFLVWGISTSIVEVEQDGEIKIRRVKPEEYFYDPYSRELDFSDARYDGIAKWMDENDLAALYPDKADVIVSSIDAAPSETYKDRPSRAWSWADRKQRRVMVFEMYHRKGAEWFRSIFVCGGILESGPSQYKDSRGRSKKCTISQSAYVDQENCRYGVVRDMIGPQDAINKGRSKAVHILNVAKLRVDPGVLDVDDVRREWARPDGIISARENQIQELGDKQLTPAHIELLRDAKDEMRRQSPTPGIVGRQGANQSGRAILAEQQAGLTEQAPVLAAFDDWTLRNYRAMWECIKQFWTAPKWVRVTDDEQAPRYILMNAVDPNTGQPFVDPNTGQPMAANSPAEMDVDIIIDSTPDTAVIHEEQFQRLAELVQAGIPIPPDVLIEASSLPKKRLLLDKLKKAQEQAQQSPQETPGSLLEKQAALESQKADLKRQDLQLQLEHSARMKDLEFAHANRQADMQASLREQAAKARPQPQFGLMLSDNAEASIAKAQEDSSLALSQAAAGMIQAAQAMQNTAAAITSMVQLATAPRRLVKDPRTGEKRVEIVPPGSMN
jgi:hypothetical protein